LGEPKRWERQIMMMCLIQAAAAPSVLDGLLTFQIPGRPIPALLALAVPNVRNSPRLKELDHV
jgi:hypothetical protein